MNTECKFMIGKISTKKTKVHFSHSQKDIETDCHSNIGILANQKVDGKLEMDIFKRRLESLAWIHELTKSDQRRSINLN